MKIIHLLALSMLIMSGAVLADPTDLSGGVFIVHYIPELAYSDEPPVGDSWCEAYESYAITSCAEQVTRIDATDLLPVSWYIISAWCEEKEWTGTELGVDDYSESLFMIMERSPCYPPSGGLEIFSTCFPCPGAGTAFVTTGEPWSGNFVPVFWTGGYAYGEAGLIQLTVDPPTGFGGWANAAMEAFPASDYGALGFNMDGIDVCPDSPSPVELSTWGMIKRMYGN